MFSDIPHPSGSDERNPRRRDRSMLAEFWQEWFETMSDLTYEAHRVCEYLARNGAQSNISLGSFDFRAAAGAIKSPSDPIDVDKLRQCLQSLDPMQAARVVYAVQAMQAMETMFSKRRSPTKESDKPDW
jgi:hypothetical protein